jgi:hypothetical protein
MGLCALSTLVGYANQVSIIGRKGVLRKGYTSLVHRPKIVAANFRTRISHVELPNSSY